VRWGRLRLERRDEDLDEPNDRAYAMGAPWPTPAPVRVTEERNGYRLEAEVVEDDRTGAPIVVGLSVRRLRRLERAPHPADTEARLRFRRRRSKARKEWRLLFAEPPTGLSLRDLRRLPLPTFLEAARMLGGASFEAHREAKATGQDVSIVTEELVDRVRRVRAPRGGPSGRSADFFPKLAAAYRAEVAKGTTNPGATLARRMGADPNLMRAWVFRMRKAGLLEPAEHG
jgi:hypothetical protein